MPFLEIAPALSLTASLGKALPLKNFLFPSKENEIISFLFFPFVFLEVQSQSCSQNITALLDLRTCLRVFLYHVLFFPLLDLFLL